MNLAKYLLVLFSGLYVSAANDEQIQEFKINGYAQGTSYSVTYYAKQEVVSKHHIDSIIQVIDKSMSLYQPNSIITKLNESTSGTLVDFHFMKVYQRAQEIFKDTEGKFDVTVAPLVQAWGFGPKKADKFPTDATIKNLLECVGMQKITRQGLNLKKDKQCVNVDLNGIAQGYTVDVIASFLHSQKVKSFMVEVGGELRVSGSKAKGELFKIGIEGPTNKELSSQSIKHILQFKRGAITTSGNYQKYVMNGNKRLSHLIDPKTGYPLDNEMISVTVFAKDAMTADGYDNALMAMSMKEALAFVAKRKQLAAYIIYKKENGEIADTLSAGFKKLILN